MSCFTVHRIVGKRKTQRFTANGLAGWLVDWLAGLVGWAGWLAGALLAGWLAGGLAGWVGCLGLPDLCKNAAFWLHGLPDPYKNVVFWLHGLPDPCENAAF